MTRRVIVTALAFVGAIVFLVAVVGSDEPSSPAPPPVVSAPTTLNEHAACPEPSGQEKGALRFAVRAHIVNSRMPRGRG